RGLRVRPSDIDAENLAVASGHHPRILHSPRKARRYRLGPRDCSADNHSIGARADGPLRLDRTLYAAFGEDWNIDARDESCDEFRLEDADRSGLVRITTHCARNHV